VTPGQVVARRVAQAKLVASLSVRLSDAILRIERLEMATRNQKKIRAALVEHWVAERIAAEKRGRVFSLIGAIQEVEAHENRAVT
jgi:hypothetical protein